MANKKNDIKDKKQIPFVPEESNKGTEILNLTDKEAYEKYIVESNGFPFGKNFDDVLNTKDDKSTSTNVVYKYKYMASLYGDVLTYIRTKIEVKIGPFIPEGYSLNAKALFDDLEAIFAENKSLTQLAATTNELNQYVKKAVDFVVSACNRGLEYQANLSL